MGVGIGAAIAIARSSSTAPAAPVADTLTPTTLNRNLDPGSPLSATAPGFTLTDQFGKRVSLRSLRGKVVVVSFNDPECTTICPLTTTALLHAKKLLGPAASQVELLGIGANPEATQVKWVRDYSQAHGMLHKWRFLTGSLAELKRVWRAYGIEAAVVKGTIDHTPATYVIDPHGRESRLFLTQMAYSSVNQLGYEIAQSIAALLPGHPRLHGTQSLAQIGLVGPQQRVTLPQAGGGSVRLGPGSGATARPVLRHVGDGGDEPRRAVSSAQRATRPSAVQARGFRRSSRSTRRRSSRRLGAADASSPACRTRSRIRWRSTGAARVADGYRVQDSPWLTLVSGSGRFLFYYDVSVKGWPTAAAAAPQGSGSARAGEALSHV